MKIPKSYKFQPEIVKLINMIVKHGYVENGVKEKPTATQLLEKAVVLFAIQHGIKPYTKCIHMAEEKGKQVYCAKFSKYVDISFCVNTCEYWTNFMRNRGISE